VIFQKLIDADPSNIAYKRNLTLTHRNIGWLLHQTRQPAQALAEFEQASLIWNERASRGNSSARDSLATCETDKASVLLALGRPGAARTSCDRAISIREDLVKANPANTGFRRGLAESLLRSGQSKRSTGDAVGATADLRRAIVLCEGLPARSGEIAMFEACCHAMLSSLAGLAGSDMPASKGALEAERAMHILRGAIAAGYRARAPRTEPALDRLRARPDFQLRMMDLAFPADPFTRGN